MTTKTKLTQADLAGFTCTDNHYRHQLTGLLYTDGVRHLARQAECYWLIDAIASYLPMIRRDDYLSRFCFWELVITPNPETGAMNQATLICRGDTDEEPAVLQEIEYTDFPDHCDINPLKLYQCSGVLMLTSEY